MSWADSEALVDAAWCAGLRYFDTAPYYGYTLSERRTGQALSTRAREAFSLSTKVGRLMCPDASVQPGDDGWAEPLPFRPIFDYTYGGVMRSYEDSLQRLGTARIDILYVHDIGAMTHGDRHSHYWTQLTQGGGFRALTQLRESGYGMGSTALEVVMSVSLPYVRRSAIGAVMLGLGRALGETIVMSFILNPSFVFNYHVLESGGNSITVMIATAAQNTLRMRSPVAENTASSRALALCSSAAIRRRGWSSAIRVSRGEGMPVKRR